jgi:hypothetical protein
VQLLAQVLMAYSDQLFSICYQRDVRLQLHLQIGPDKHRTSMQAEMGSMQNSTACARVVQHSSGTC